ncbi:MAG: hypothetical protein OXE81_11375 [Gammaproteobacteria bacterium]|nr:hypothetical protein [Gammaproteobacteria bacterium]MCY4278414.1 hypothetical protein [Gammaproteobacteria bacterium]
MPRRSIFTLALADIIAIPGDPLSQIEQFGKVHFVMKGGEVFRRETL